MRKTAKHAVVTKLHHLSKPSLTIYSMSLRCKMCQLPINADSEYVKNAMEEELHQ